MTTRSELDYMIAQIKAMDAVVQAAWDLERFLPSGTPHIPVENLRLALVQYNKSRAALLEHVA